MAKMFKYKVTVGGYPKMVIKAATAGDARVIAQAKIRLRYNNLKKLTPSNASVKRI